MGFLQNFDNAVRKYLKDKKGIGSIQEKEVVELLAIEKKYLDNIFDVLSTFDSKVLNNLRDQFIATPKRNDKINNAYIIPALMKDTRGKAQQLERTMCFGSMLHTCNFYRKLHDELIKHMRELIDEKVIIFESSRMSDVMLLGILREMDLFTKYATYLFSYFSGVVNNDHKEVGYRQSFLQKNYEKYVKLVNDVCNKENNYSFLKEVIDLRKQAGDLVLYANGNSFASMFDFRKYTQSNENHLTAGIFGFGIISYIVEKFDLWKHAQYQKQKIHAEWLKQEKARLMQKYLRQDPESRDGIRTQELIDAYSEAMTDLDQKLAEYEHVDETDDEYGY